jgi:hypothetical protein
MSVTRSVTLDNLTAREIAELFCGLDSEAQAEVFNHITDIARDWSGAGWCQQANSILTARSLTDEGRKAIGSLADHLGRPES